jgi:hypothetical protein
MSKEEKQLNAIASFSSVKTNFHQDPNTEGHSSRNKMTNTTFKLYTEAPTHCLSSYNFNENFGTPVYFCGLHPIRILLY